MLPKEFRLNLGKDFKWVASGSPRSAGGAGKKIDTKFTKLFLKTSDNVSPRIGIATSGKIFKKATQRNRGRRLVSYALEKLYQRLPSNINIVALPKVGVLEVKSKEVLLDLEEALRRENVIARIRQLTETKQSSKDK